MKAPSDQTLAVLNPFLLEHGHRRPRDLPQWLIPAGMALVGLILIAASALVKP